MTCRKNKPAKPSGLFALRRPKAKHRPRNEKRSYHPKRSWPNTRFPRDQRHGSKRAPYRLAGHYSFPGPALSWEKMYPW
jgi:hypothetical protein